MSDFTLEEVAQGLGEKAVVPPDSVFTVGDKLEQETQRLKNIKNADGLATADAFVETAKNVNFAVESFRWADKKVMDGAFDDDPNFVMDDSTAMKHLQSNGLTIKSFSDVRDAKSQGHLDMMTQRMKGFETTDKMTQNNLGENASMAAGITGAVLDVDLVGGVVVGIATKASTITKMIAVEGAYEATLVTARQLIKDDYTGGDAAFDMIIGTGMAAGGGFAVKAMDRRVKVKEANSAPESTVESTSTVNADIDDMANSFRDKDLPKDKPKDFKTDDAAPEIIKKEEVAKPVKLTTKQRASDASAYTKANTTHYNVPNANKGKRTVTDTIITHRTAGHGFHPNDTRLTKKGLGAHYTITKDGKIHQINDDGDKMWHAGSMNGRSVGIEVTGKFDPKTQTWEKMTNAQKKSLGELGRVLSTKYKIPLKNIKGHVEVAAKSANEGMEAKLYLQRVLKENPKKTQKRLAKLNKNLDDALDPKAKAMANRAIDDEVVESGRRANRSNDVEEANARDTEQRPTRTKTHAQNRKELFEKASEAELSKTLENIKKIKKEGGSPDIIQAKMDKEMDRLYSQSFDNPNMRLMRIVDEMGDDVDNAKFEIENMRQNDPEGFKGAMDNMRLSDEVLYSDIADMVTTPATKESADAFVSKMVKDGKMTKKMAVALTTLLGGTALHAGDGDNHGAAITAGFLALVMTGVFGRSVLKAIKAGGIKALGSKVRSNVATSFDKGTEYVSKDATTRRRLRKELMSNVHTRFTSAVAPFIKAGPKTEELITDWLYSAEKGGGAELDKASWSHSTMARYADMEKETFKMFKTEQGIKGFNGFLQEVDTVNDFRTAITDATELLETDKNAFAKLPDSLKKAAKDFDNLKKEIYDRANEYEVFGFVDRVDGNGKTVKGITHEEGKVPRYWNSGRMNELITRADDPEAAALAMKDSLSKAFYKSMGDQDAADRIAERFTNDWATGQHLHGSSKVKSGDDIFDAIEDLLEDDISAKDVGEALTLKRDRIARAKERLKLNVIDIEPVTFKVGGEDVIIDRNVIFERDAKAILDRTANSIYGHSAMAKNGYKSVKAMDAAINDATKGVPNGATLRTELQQVKDLVLGVPIPSNSKFLHNISMMMKDLTIVSKLPLVAFSMPPEVIAALTTSTLTRGLRSFVRAIRKQYPKDSNMIQMMKMAGLGTSFKRMDFSGFRGATDDLDDVGVVGKLREGTMKMRDFSLVVNGLSYFSDGLQRMGMELHTEKLAQFLLHGDVSAKGIPAHRKLEFGIDDDFIAMFKNTFELDGNAVKEFDSSKWSIKKQDAYAKVLRNMNQQVSPETTIGETGLYTRTTDMGRSISGLLTYPMQQFNLYGVNDTVHMDRGLVVHSLGAFMGAYIGLSLRYAAQDKDMSEEDLAMYALMNIPQLGAFTTMKSMLDPASFGVARDAFNVMAPATLEVH